MRKPAAKRNTLTLIAGIVWSLTGLFLSSVALSWLVGSEIVYLIIAVIGGIGVGWLIYHFKFGELANQNIQRIYSQSPGQDKVCVFAFQNFRSYFLVIIMMTMGYLVRHSGVPKPYLAPFYFAIGAAMFLSSIAYYRHLRRAA
ncbi:MAG: hypothetical protein WBP29_02490 [Candidatus Zixiibacteriota bacterium]